MLAAFAIHGKLKVKKCQVRKCAATSELLEGETCEQLQNTHRSSRGSERDKALPPHLLAVIGKCKKCSKFTQSNKRVCSFVFSTSQPEVDVESQCTADSATAKRSNSTTQNRAAHPGIGIPITREPHRGSTTSSSFPDPQRHQGPIASTTSDHWLTRIERHRRRFDKGMRRQKNETSRCPLVNRQD